MKKLLFVILAAMPVISQAQNRDITDEQIIYQPESQYQFNSSYYTGCHFMGANGLGCGVPGVVVTPQQTIPSPPESQFKLNSAFYKTNHFGDESGQDFSR